MTPEEIKHTLATVNAKFKRLREIVDGGPLDDDQATEAESLMDAIEDGMQKLGLTRKEVM